jgi:putative membrane-bound dehydrogenase-like protein
MLTHARTAAWNIVLLSVISAAGTLSSCKQAGPPYSATEALKTFQLEPGFQMDLFAHEPDVADPVAMEIDEYGRIYVVESPGYPLETGRALGRVKLLEDTNGDGLPDRSSLFADELTMPTGVMRWKQGILVTDAPNVWYMEDTDQDGKADVKRVVLEGFAFTNPQHTVNAPTYGLDNWVYLAHERPTDAKVFVDEFGDQGTPIRFPDRDDISPLDAQGRNIRFRPDTHKLEVLSGTSQYGQTFDEWGRHFGVNNPNTGRHEVIAARYLERNPDLLLSSVMKDLSEDRHVSFVTERPESPRKEAGLQNFGRITSACSITFYMGGAFPEKYRNIAFIAEPAHNTALAHTWSPLGASFVAERLHSDREFLASKDSWSRPVNFYVGPDGALYVIDYYRRIIEHPEWTSREVYESEAIYHGNDKGRIYRIVPAENPPPLPRDINLGDVSDQELVSQLGNPNIWWRRTAQRLLIDRGNKNAAAALAEFFGETESPLGKLHALWTLDGLGKSDTTLIQEALDAPEAGLRENAIQLSESHLANSPELVEELLKMSDDPDPRVRFQLLCTLGFVNSSAARAARDRLLARDIEDRWMQVAALSSSSDEGPRLFQMAVAELASSPTEGRANFFRQVASVIAARGSREIRRVLQTVVARSDGDSDWWRAASLDGLAEGFRGRSSDSSILTVQQQGQMLKLFESPAGSVRRASLKLLEAIGLPQSPAVARAVERAAKVAESSEADADHRVDVIGLLALAGPAAHESMLKKLVDPQEPQEVQAAAVHAIGQLDNEEVGVFLLKNWRAMTSAVRMAATEALFLDPARIRLLLEAIRNGEIQSWTMSARWKFRLVTHPDESIRAEAQKLLRAGVDEREQVVERYESAIAMDGDVERGRQVFEEVCSKCHTFNGVGKEVGPDLGEVRNRPRELLLADILMPNKSIAQQYESYVVELASGETFDGVMGPQTPTTITIRQEEGKEHLIRRSDIESFYVADLSAMAEDLEEQVDIQQMADLLTFIKTGQ